MVGDISQLVKRFWNCTFIIEDEITKNSQRRKGYSRNFNMVAKFDAIYRRILLCVG